jgi:N-acetylated-alpha-linked acidic dipeptidase
MVSKVSVSLVFFLWTCAAGVAAPGVQTPANGSGMLGFSKNGAARERQLEKRFDANLNAKETKAWLKRLASAPNQSGSPHDKANAEWILAQFRKWGWDAHIETFKILFPTPRKELLEMIAPHKFMASLKEPPIQGDPTSYASGIIPPYLVYAPDGDVTGKLVYVNYGLPSDYEMLARLGVSVKGKIAIVRYGHSWRGLKLRLAYEHGAIGCILYSDPRDEGYFQGDPYPEGGWRPDHSVQRGSVENQPRYYPGDPSVEGGAPLPGAKRVSVANMPALQKIPAIPISAADAAPLLKALGGPVASEDWRGALPFTYHVGPGPAKVHLVVKSNWNRLTTIYDVIAKLPGSAYPNQWVIRGNHHDGWVIGADDPLSGTVAELAEAKSLGALYRAGWRPKRTIVFASWDAEEQGLLGSTAWAEAHASELRQKAVVYFNTDAGARGFLSAGGSPSFQRLLNQVAADVTDPETGVSVLARMRAHQILKNSREGSSDHDESVATSATEKGGGHKVDILFTPLGTGSDYSAFLSNLGIPSVNFGFDDEGPGGATFHSLYDSFSHFARFSEPTFKYRVALAEISGRLVMRVADAKVLPMRFEDVGASLVRYDKQLHQEIKNKRRASEQQTRLLAAGVYPLNSDPVHPIAPPKRLPDVPTVDLSALDRAVKDLDASVQAYEKAYGHQVAAGLAIPPDQLTKINSLMLTMQRYLLRERGLPGRPWYKYVVTAPGIYKGYGAETLPAVHEALDAHEWSRAEQGAVMTAGVLDHYRGQLDKLTALLIENQN